MNRHEIKDSTGASIAPFSIVEITEDVGSWSGFQGLVIEPDSDIEGDEFCVAVYFFAEVKPDRFLFDSRNRSNTARIWDETYREENRSGKGEFLLKDDVWKTSPRVVFFRPTELIVKKRWSVEILAKRFFPNRYHTICGLSEKFPADPEAYMCCIAACRKPATDIAVCNVWGSVYPIFMCKDCALKMNGLCGEDLPELKRPFLAPDGTPLVLLE